MGGGVEEEKDEDENSKEIVFSMDSRIEGLPLYTLLLPSSPFNRGQLKFPPVGSSFRPSRRFVLEVNPCILYQCLVLDGGEYTIEY